MKVLSRIKMKAATDTGKYNPGDFGYWWTVEKRRKILKAQFIKVL